MANSFLNPVWTPSAVLPEIDLSDEERGRLTIMRLTPVLADSPRNALMGIGASLLVAIVTWSSLARQPGQWVPWVWWAAYAAIACWIIVLVRRFEKGPQTPEHVLRASRALIPPVAAAGAVWSSCAWLFLPSDVVEYQYLLILAHAMVLMGVANGRSNDRSSLLAFMVPAALVFISGVMRFADIFHLVVGLGFLVFTFGLAGFARVQRNAIDSAVASRLVTERLLRERTEQQRETEAARSEAVKAREMAVLADRAKTTLLVAASHDLRQPMHALVQYYGQLQRRNGDPALAETIGRIGKAMDSMQDLLNAILEVSKLMMGSVKPVLRRVDVALLLDRLEAQLRPLAEDKGLNFHLEGVRGVVRTDEVMLERILRNLAVNAIRYTDRGSVTIVARTTPTGLRIRVADTGLGIARSELHRIFEAFYQIANEARERRKGLGLGLAIVREMSQLLGYRTAVRSREGVGSIFTVHIPSDRLEATPSNSAQQRQSQDYARGAFVVLIDDNEESRASTEATLRLYGCRLLSARSGAHALELLQDHEFVPQLIVADYRLVAETGIEAIEMVIGNLRALYGEELAIGALIISGDTGPGEMQRVADAGYLMMHKPVKVDALYEAVNAQLQYVAVGGRQGGDTCL